MAFKEKQTLKCFLLIWLIFIKVSGFVVFNEGKKHISVGPSNKNARSRQSFDRGNKRPKSGERVGRLLIWQDQASNSHGDGSDSFSSDLGSQSRPDENEYQSEDSGWMTLQPLWGQVYDLNTLYTPAVERLLEMKPKVDCVGDLMKLTVHGQEAPFGSGFLIDRGSIPPLPLSRLPSDCGHRFLRTWRDFVFIIPYDGCYVSQERNTFILPLLWWGLPVKMSCSSQTSAQRAPTVSCYTNGMIVRLHREVSENLKIKVMNEWQPLLKVSARCGYSLVSHAESVVIHAPYLPCTEPKDGMFTLSMAVESVFHLSCPALSLNLPISMPDLAPENFTPTSMPHALVSSTLPPSTSSAIQKLLTPPLPYYIPGQPNFKPVPPSYSSNVPPMVVPQSPKIVSPPTAITQKPQAPVYVKRPHTWYPWYPKPSLGLTPVLSQSTALPFPRKPLLPPTKAPKTPPAPLLKPTSIPQDKLMPTMPIVPPAQWAPMFPPRNLVYPLYPGKPGFVAPSSAVFPQDPYWPYSQTQTGPSKPHAPPKPESEPPIPAPTRKAGPQHFHYPWYKPFPPRYSVMPPVPTKVPQINTVPASGAVASNSTTQKPVVKGPPMSLDFDFAPSTDPTPSLPEFPEVNTPAPIKACLTPNCPTFCPGPPSISYHQHNHHHFGPPLPMPNLDISILTKIRGQMLSSPVISAGSTPFPLVQGLGYNYGPLSSQGLTVRLASDGTAVQYLAENPIIKGTNAPDTSKLLTGPTICPSIFRKLESTTASTQKFANVSPVINPLGPSNGPVDEPRVYSNQSPKLAVYQAEMGQNVAPWGHHMQPMLVAPNNFPFFEKMPHDISSNPTMPPAHDKKGNMNYGYQATYSNAKPPISDSPTKDSVSLLSLLQPSNNHNSFEPLTIPLQPEQISGKNLPVMNPWLYNPQSGESVLPVFRDTYWVPAVQSNQDALLSSYHPDGYMRHPFTVDQGMWRAGNYAN
ncbi:proline-rich extensin-like protein EPR1 [Megalobrama amblycephala]|uniref:proline-rich extensin-like protein EPR1 n=1 Tax=Megalobrama amblycephala TaxID=75352 RepID=UPI0020144F20|nr:proline-rich extensin-like protein EPR1 [Megalobrama amblycephala]